MVKIRDLSDQQLVSQLEKYEKIYNQLVNEREKRVGSRGDTNGLLTSNERQIKALKEPPKSTSQEAGENQTQAFQLKFDDAELDQMKADEERREHKNDPETEEVRVTQLLKLSQEQLEELRNPAPKKVIKKKKVLKKREG